MYGKVLGTIWDLCCNDLIISDKKFSIFASECPPGTSRFTILFRYGQVTVHKKARNSS